MSKETFGEVSKVVKRYSCSTVNISAIADDSPFVYVTRFAKIHIFENTDFCIVVFCMPKALICSSIKSVIQIGLELQG